MHDIAKWHFADAVRASGIPPVRLARWLDRGTVVLRGCDQDSDASGVPRLLSTRRVLQIAIAHELTRLGIAPSRAAEAALRFTDVSQPGREPCELSATGKTWLVVLPERADVVSVDDPSSLSSDLASLMLPARSAAVVIVNLNSIVARVSAALQN